MRGQYESGHVLNQLLAAARHGTPFTVAGVNWPTRDGTAIRDYVHVWDLAEAYVRSLTQIDSLMEPGSFLPLNLGTGTGTTVRELIQAFLDSTDLSIRTINGTPRPGDVVGSYADPSLANELLGWRASLALGDAIVDAVAWDNRSDSTYNAGL